MQSSYSITVDVPFYELDSVADDAVADFLSDLRRRLDASTSAWYYHNEHMHPGNLEMCQDQVCRTQNNMIECVLGEADEPGY